MAYWLAVILAVFVMWCLYSRYSRAGRLIAKIPGPKDVPFFGNAFNVVLPTDELFIFLRDMYKTFGGMTKLYAFHLRCVSVYEPDDVELILSTTRFNDKDKPYTFLKPWLSDGLLISNGSKWQHRRKMLTPAFHFNILKKYTQTFTEQTEEFLQTVKGEVGKEKTDLIPLISRTTLHIITETAMGISIDEGNDSIMKSYFDAVYIVGECVVKRLCRVLYFIDAVFNMSALGRAQKQALKNLHGFTDKVIRERKEFIARNSLTEFTDDNEVYGKKGRLAMLDLLIQNEKDEKIDVKGIREEVDTFMFEGHDTTAMALSFMIMRIANEPEVQENIYDEMRKIFGTSQRLPTMTDFNDMKYLECCIKESLRIYPSVPFIAREITEETVLSGYTIPPNTEVHIHIYDIHHRADIYPNPEKFIPERFLPENNLKRHPYAYIPFSAGPRNCIGQKFAMLEMKTVLSGLLRRFRVEPITKPEDITFASDLVLRSNRPLYVRFCDRQ
ncbi:cytochrome P450 4C1-like [Epargyreus clarus]|uniref:cytochrome P450 4C1-like n=1 Tax=Epargyreus clarus TaxID=520877 RepID=UPI003C30CFA1